MKVIGVETERIITVVNRISEEEFGGNLLTSVRDRTKPDGRISRATFSLNVYGDGPGACWAVRKVQGCMDLFESDRACWHAHYSVMKELISGNPHCTIQTSRATFSISAFYDTALATALVNLGTELTPVYATELCGCGSEEWPFEQPEPRGARSLPVVIPEQRRV